MEGELFVKTSRGERPTDPLAMAMASSGDVMEEASGRNSNDGSANGGRLEGGKEVFATMRKKSEAAAAFSNKPGPRPKERPCMFRLIPLCQSF